MSIEPGIAALVAATEPVMTNPAALVDWTAYAACRICRAATGQPCTSVYGRIAAGRPEGGPRALPVAHGHRKRRAGR
jgi:hypothetical protein